ncbi:hypothetical protein SpiGrapes_0432 [Sphaerochaeta pleomorpha str. Grapes]|uniref:ABC-2 transporter permease n=1 Tax=Sphaerochaeta pleomorpha (strain ATCC BAA-1885 / DSM 22778 / Grapes) TaxID=158190 RepID=G8QW47_SPHPG|nr:ABC-2 transporter permease [Sphaerochaeta pleomorpha]AEV28290.1 hypothetical protein SpiGrapes_0432 [Sphaerochaeta pleomorpha str. Grapes]
MHALLVKDWYILKKEAKWTIVLAVVSLAIVAIGRGMYFSFLSAIIVTKLPVMVMGYDEKSKWNRYALGLPFSRSVIVREKYVLALLCLGLSVVLTFLVGSVVNVFRFGNPSILALLRGCAVQLAIGISITSLGYPIFFKLGLEKGRFWYTLLLFALLAGIGAGVSLVGGNILSSCIDGTALSGVLCILALPLLGSSLLLSQRFFANKDI